MAMTGLENIIREIEAEGAETAAAIRREARDKAEAVVKTAEAAARETADGYKRAAENAAREYTARAAANDEAEFRRAVLDKKQSIIRETLAEAKRRLTDRTGGSYFETMTRLIEKHAAEKSGSVLLCEGDRERMPKAFEAALEARGLKVSDKTLKADGGFILDYGSIEINCTFEALFDAYSEELSDMLNTLLFGNEGGV